MHALIRHPDSPPGSVDRVMVNLPGSASREVWLEYSVSPTGRLVLPAEKAPVRTDGLWNSTCFELFVQPVGSDLYFEFNFSPSFQWAAYQFSSYRSGMTELPSHDPDIWITLAGEHFFLAVEAMPGLPPTALKIGLSAVIEETDGTKSYWALNHPPGAPDFHHPDCFVLELPAPDAA